MQVTPELNREPLFGQGRSHPSVRCCALRLTDSRLIIHNQGTKSYPTLNLAICFKKNPPPELWERVPSSFSGDAGWLGDGAGCTYTATRT